MNTRTVDPRTVWTVVAMEASLVLPLISLPTQGDRVPGLIGPLLLLALLPLGCAAVYVLRALRDPSWRLLAAIALALSTRAIVSEIPEPGVSGVLMWLARSFVPAAIGIGLWWRGGALAVSELTPAEVRTEFSVLALCMVVTLALIRPFLLPDAVLLGTAVGLFAVAGLIGTALSRQDAAEITTPRLGRALAIGTALLPAALAVLLIGSLRPELLTSMWLLLARAIELLLTPIGLFLAWLASLLPRGAPTAPPLPPAFPTPVPNPAAGLDQVQDRMAWIASVIIFTLLLCAAAATLLAVRLLLTNFIRDPEVWTSSRQREEVETASSGTPADEVGDMLGWLMRWLRRRFGRRASREGHAEPNLSAWPAYQRLLGWAEGQGLGRRPAETTRQFSNRLGTQVPEAATVIDLLTQTFEWERYGGETASREKLQLLGEAVSNLR